MAASRVWSRVAVSGLRPPTCAGTPIRGPIRLFAGSEACEQGFIGPDCGVCQSNSACTVSTNNDNATCSTDFNYASNSITKSYSCQMAPGLFQALVRANTTYITCHTGLKSGSTLENGTTTAANGAPAAEGDHNVSGTCDIGFTLDSSNVPVVCAATGCSMGAGSPNVACLNVTCSCESQDCPAGIISGMVQGVNGKASLECDGTGQCSIALNGLPVESIAVQCVTGECLVPTPNSLSNNTANSGTEVDHLDVNPFIAAIPIMILFLLLVGISAYAVLNRRYWQPFHGDTAELEALAAGKSRGGGFSHRAGVLT